ncbi:response regulator transcription factor [Kribbella sandramycini]|uniref:DNA-binding NarL/FixJ family response regulator n=1 Tax=Kribbella sandramycini TaxID=60450 RepID=A0A7Y4L281_9ACTN|nr:response regulator transcription factor [Kribbella sandramycini]MBB6566349.1 DNA-binding NarL/FixJ family response regulator [Kribbella sandramycini]NOL42990.1 response regulator transcription factor [Kribbella sandramycini]
MAAAAELTETEQSPIRILVADDQGVIRMGLAMILDHEPDLTTVAQAGDGEEALRLIEQYDPDVVLMDIRMPVMDGLVATERITTANKASGRSKPAVLVLTTFDDEAYVLSAVRAGASGFLLKDTDPDLLVSAVRAVHRGDSLVDPASTRVLLERCVELERQVGGVAPSAPAQPDARWVGMLAQLSEREREILVWMARGLSNRDLAGKLFVSETTVKTHVSSVLSKLGLSSRVQAVVVAYEAGVVRPGEADVRWES